jgi:hypothetical protein
MIDGRVRPFRLACARPILPSVLLGVLLLLAVAAVPLFGGRLRRLTELRVRWIGVAAAAFAVQILVVNVLPGGDEGLHEAINIATYVVLAAVIVRNLRLPGLPLIALGGVSNALAIVANGGVMPARAGALRFAGMPLDPDAFTNSAYVHHAKLWFLGDVFGVPSWVPAANVFSIGDLLLVLGGWVLVHRACGSRLFTRRADCPAPSPAAFVFFDAEGAVEAVTPEAEALLAHVDASAAVPSAIGVPLPAEAYVVAGEARSLGSGPAHAEFRDGRGRWLTLTARCFDLGDGVARTSLAIAA